MIALICLLVPSILLVIMRSRLTEDKNALYQKIIQYVCSTTILNFAMVLILRIFFHNRGKLFFKLKHSHVFAMKYLALSSVLAIIFPFIEKFWARVFGNKLSNLPWTKEGNRGHSVCKLLKDSLFFRLAVLFQIFFLLYICWLNLEPKYERTFDKTEIFANHENVIAFDNGYQIARLNEEQKSATVLKTKSFELAPGAYEIAINYDVELEAGETASFSVNQGNLNLASNHHGSCYSWPRLPLRDSLNSVSQRVYIKSIAAINDFSLQVEYSGTAPLTVRGIQIREIIGYRFIRFFFPLILFIIFDALFVYFYAEGKKKRAETACLTAVILLSSLPVFSDFILSGHDLSFHLNRIINFAEQIQAGNLWPSVYFTEFNGYGCATPLFYAQLFLYVPSVLYAMGMSLTTSYLIFLFVVNLSSCFISYYCIKKCCDDSELALTGSAIYTLCSYRLTNIYVRAALGEYVAMCFLPLVIYGFYRIYTAPKGQKLSLADYFPAVIGLSGIAQSHIVSVEMVAILITIFCAVTIEKTLEWNRFLGLAKAAALTLLLNLFTVVPFISGMMMNIRGKASVSYMEGRGVYLMQILGIFYPGYQYSGVREGAQHEMPLSIGFSLTLGLALFLIVYMWRTEFRKDKRYQLAAGTFLLSLITIFFASTLCQWDSLDMISHDLFDLLTKIQFPWRYLSLASAFATFCAVASLAIIREKSIKGYRCASTVIIAILILNAGIFMMHQIDTSSTFKAASNTYQYNMNGGGAHYLIKGTDTSLFNYRNLIYDASQLNVTDYVPPKNGVASVSCENTGTDDVLLEFPLQNYENYHAYDAKTGDKYEIVNGSNNRLSINVSGGYAGTITVEYRIPFVWKLSYLISGITAAFVVAFLLMEKRKKHAIEEFAHEKT